LEIAFADRDLRDICELQLRAEHVLGIAPAANLRARLADIRDAASIQDLAAGEPTVRSSRPPGRVSLELGQSFQLFFCANHVKNPVNEKQEVDWPRVSRVKILQIETDK
jgi:hypothetical protein